MTIDISKVEVISAAVGVVIGYKLKSQIQAAITNIKKTLSTAIAPKP